MTSIRELWPEDDLIAVLTLCRDFSAEYEGHHKEFSDTDNLSDADISGRFLQNRESWRHFRAHGGEGPRA